MGSAKVREMGLAMDGDSGFLVHSQARTSLTRENERFCGGGGKSSLGSDEGRVWFFCWEAGEVSYQVVFAWKLFS